jgi:branched-chain amino acid transport system substrate-binding protein
MNRQHFNRALAALALSAGTAALARKQYDPGASDTEIKIGAIHPYSGPASAYGTIGKAIGAYFDKVNAEGGIHGRRIRYLALDDGYNPARTLEMARRLVEQDEALLVFNPLGTAANTAIHRYLNQQKVPQLFVSSGATKWNDPKSYPWTMGWHPDYQTEARIYAEHILQTRPQARIAVLYQNDDYGKDYLKGFEDGLGDKARSMIVARVTYEVTDPTVDSQMVTLKASGADVFFNVTTPKFAALAIRKAAEMGWKPVHYLNSVSSGVGSVLTPAGPAHAVGVISATYYKDPSDPQFHQDKAYQDWLAWMKAYYPQGDLKDNLNVYGYNVAQTLVQVLRQCGDTLTRENVMKQAANLNFTLPMLLPGIDVKTAPDDYRPIERLRLMRFDGRAWVLFGSVYGR